MSAHRVTMVNHEVWTLVNKLLATPGIANWTKNGWFAQKEQALLSGDNIRLAALAQAQDILKK